MNVCSQQMVDLFKLFALIWEREREREGGGDKARLNLSAWCREFVVSEILGKVLVTENDVKHLSHRNVRAKTQRFDATIECNIATTHTVTGTWAHIGSPTRTHTQAHSNPDGHKIVLSQLLKYNTFIDSLSLQIVTVIGKGDYSPACDNGFITQSINTKYQGLSFHPNSV